MSTRQKESKQFTLIELLIVISIIAILASMLLPASSKAREKGKSIECTSNLKQQFNAITMYLNDYRGWFPNITDGYKWELRLAPYMNIATNLSQAALCKKKVFTCPSVTSWLLTLDHRLNGYARTPVFSNGNGHHYSQLSPRYYSQQSIVGDCARDEAFPASQYYKYWSLQYSFEPSYTAYRHSKGGNLLFYDGHCSWHPVHELAAHYFTTQESSWFNPMGWW